MLNAEYVDGHKDKTCFSGALQEGSLSSRETQQSWKEPSSTQSWRRVVAASASLWLEETSQMSSYRSKVWCWMGLQLWMARWRQVQYITTIHRGHCFHSTTHTVVVLYYIHPFSALLIGPLPVSPLMHSQTFHSKVHEGSGMSHREFSNCLRALWAIF